MISAGMVLRVGDLPVGLKLKEGIPDDPDHLLLKGGSCIFAPDGSILLEPQNDLDDTIIFEIPDIEMTQRERMNLDVSGHYNRPDIFDLKINKERH